MAAAQILDNLTSRPSKVYTGAEYRGGSTGINLAKDLDAGLKVYIAEYASLGYFVAAKDEDDARYILGRFGSNRSAYAELTRVDAELLHWYFPPISKPTMESTRAGQVYGPHILQASEQIKAQVGLSLAQDLDAGLQVFRAHWFGMLAYASAPNEDAAREKLRAWRPGWIDADLRPVKHKQIAQDFPPARPVLAEAVARTYNPADWYELWPDLGRRLAEAIDAGFRVWSAYVNRRGVEIRRFVVARDENEARDLVDHSAAFANARGVQMRELSIDQIHTRFMPVDPPVVKLGLTDVEF